MSNELKLLYDRYNQFSSFEYTVCNPNTMIKILREGSFDESILEEKIFEYEIKGPPLLRWSFYLVPYMGLIGICNVVK